MITLTEFDYTPRGGGLTRVSLEYSNTATINIQVTCEGYPPRALVHAEIHVEILIISDLSPLVLPRVLWVRTFFLEEPRLQRGVYMVYKGDLGYTHFSYF